MVRTVSVSRVLIQTATCVWVVSVATVTHIGLTQLALLYLLNWSQPWFCRSLRDDFHGKRIACKVTRFICHVIFNFFTVFHTCYLPQCAKSDAASQFEMTNLIRNLRKKNKTQRKVRTELDCCPEQSKSLKTWERLRVRKVTVIELIFRFRSTCPSERRLGHEFRIFSCPSEKRVTDLRKVEDKEGYRKKSLKM